MPCCGKKRAALTVRSIPSPAPLQSAAQPAASGEASRPTGPAAAALRYLGQRSIALRGPRSGRVYTFDPTGDATVVEARDLDALLRTGLFGREKR
jgi:hypothetical protein